MVFFNTSSGTTITEDVNIQHISLFGICEDVRHFAQHYYGQSQRSHAWDSGAIQREERTLLHAKIKLLHS